MHDNRVASCGAVVDHGTPTARRIAAARATGPAGHDVRRALAAVDGDAQVLPTDGRLRLGVVLPVLNHPERFSDYSLAAWAAVEDQVKDGIVFQGRLPR